MASKHYTTKQEFLKNAKTLLSKNVPIGTQTGWREYLNGYVHYVNGHMQNDPDLNVAIVRFNSDGNLAGEEFRENGHRHNENGAAVIEYSSTGTILKQEYYLKGIEYNFQDYQTKLKSILKPSYVTFGTRKIRIKELKEKFGNFIKEDTNGNILNVKELTKDNFNLDKYGDSDGTINYGTLNKDTAYVNNNILFTTNYEVTKPTSWAITPNGDLVDPRYYTNSTTPILNWSQKIFETTPSGVPFWIEQKEFDSLNIPKGTKIPELKDSKTIKATFDDFLSPFNKQTHITYVYQDNFFYVIKDAKTNVVYEKRVPLRPKLIKNDTEIDMEWEKELTAFQKAGYVAGLTSKPVSITKEEFNRVHSEVVIAELAKQQNQQPVMNSGSLGPLQPQVTPSKTEPLLSKEVLEQISKKLAALGFGYKITQTKNGDIDFTVEPLTNPGVVQAAMSNLTVPPFVQDFNKTPYSVSGSTIQDFSKLLPYTVSGAAVNMEYKAVSPEMFTYLFGSGSKVPKTINSTKPVSEEKENKFVKTVKSDAKEVAKRIATQQVSSFVHKLLVEFLSKKQNKAKTEIEKFLISEKGKVAMSLAVGATLPLLIDYFPEKYRDVLQEIGSEFRIQAETEIALALTDNVVAPFVSQLGHGLSTFELFSGNNTERVRVQVSESLTEPTGEAIESEESIFSSEVSSNQKTLN